MADKILREIGEPTYNYLGCSSNPYLSRHIDARGRERFYWFGPSGTMYRPLPDRGRVSSPAQ